MPLELSGLSDWSSRRASLPAELAEALLSHIRTGEFEVGTQLPSEPKLAKTFNVSRNTIREAIAVLREQGFVVTRHGIGTFVRSDGEYSQWPVAVGIEQLVSTSDLIRRAGRVPGSRDSLISTMAPTPQLAERFNLHDVGELYSIERVRTADDLPVILCRDYIRTDAVPTDVMNRYRAEDSLFEFLQKERGYRVQAARATVLPVMPTRRVAELLEVSRKEPLLALYQVHHDEDGEAFLYSENYFNLAYIDVHVRRTPPS